MYEVCIRNEAFSDTMSLRFRFAYISDAIDFAKMTLSNAYDDIVVSIVRCNRTEVTHD